MKKSFFSRRLILLTHSLTHDSDVILSSTVMAAMSEVLYFFQQCNVNLRMLANYYVEYTPVDIHGLR